ncbi:GTP-binding protein [Myxococcota bacterium]|nr:GTP-binding protein [Myxococcota bacterium]MCZ7619160.1 GTP-binding protein [Myxococcota bacterium]
MSEVDRIPVLVVAGFLGSGKTSLVRHLLAEAQAAGVRVAVVSNEFGALGIDRALLAGADTAPGGVPIRELEGGCVCCELTDDLVNTLEALRREVAPDQIVIETSGVALPYDVQLSLWRPPVSEWISDDLGIVVVNAEQLAEGRDLGPTFEQQVSAADLLVLNQVDRVDEARLPALETQLRALEPDAVIVRAVHGQVDRALLVPPETPRGGRVPRDGHVCGDGHVHERFASELIDVEAGIAPDTLIARLRGLGALRAKGWVETPEGTRLVQGVGRRIELSPGAPPGPEWARRVVVIRRVD